MRKTQISGLGKDFTRKRKKGTTEDKRVTTKTINSALSFEQVRIAKGESVYARDKQKYRFLCSRFG